MKISGIFCPDVVGGAILAHFVQPAGIYQILYEKTDISLKAQGAGGFVGKELVEDTGRLVNLAGSHGPGYKP